MHSSKKVQVMMKERDHELLHYLAVTRMLTVEQLGLLTHPGLDVNNVRARLTQLGEGSLTRKAGLHLVERKSFNLLGAPLLHHVWMLSERGRRLVEATLNLVVPVREATVHPQFMHHAVTLNDLFVRIVASGACRPQLSAVGPGMRSEHGHFIGNLEKFTWHSFNEAHLPWRERVENEEKDRRLEPDAILTLPGQARYFIENERGGHPVESEDIQREGATLKKVERYEQYFMGYADYEARLTHYRKQFADKLPAALVFLVPGERRRDFIKNALRKWKGPLDSGAKFVQCYTLEEASRVFGKMINGPDFRPEVLSALEAGLPFPLPGKGQGKATHKGAGLGAEPELKALQAQLEESRARVGRRDVTIQELNAQLQKQTAQLQEQARLLEEAATVTATYYSEAYHSIHETRERLRRAATLASDKLRDLLALPRYPASSDTMDALVKRLASPKAAAASQKQPTPSKEKA